jgi:nucleoid-associated protein EbfC
MEGNMFDMSKMMEKIKEVQEKMKTVQEELGKLTVSAESGAGMVKATVNGKKQLLSLEVDNELIKPDDKEMLEDLIVAAVNRALEEADAKAKEHMKQSTQGFIPNIPGLDFGNLA